jgi:hypothetical protein
MDLTLGLDLMEPSKPLEYVGYVVKQASSLVSDNELGHTPNIIMGKAKTIP